MFKYQHREARPNTRIATWNLNNRVGRVPFRHEAAEAAIGLDADIVILNEYYPGKAEPEFAHIFDKAGWHHLQTACHPEERANCVLIASKEPLELLPIEMPDFDRQFPSNILAVKAVQHDLVVIGIRIPWYSGADAKFVNDAWDWLESMAAKLADRRAIILGDLNVELNSPRSRGGEHFRRILNAGWHRAAPESGGSFYTGDGRYSEIDHILGTRFCQFENAEYVSANGSFVLARAAGAVSDHCELTAEVSFDETRK